MLGEVLEQENRKRGSDSEQSEQQRDLVKMINELKTGSSVLVWLNS